jgi:4-amino-4-deoxy-L-arabinose transferase-like glycosyltransferase
VTVTAEALGGDRESISHWLPTQVKVLTKQLRLIAFAAVVGGLVFRTLPLLMNPQSPLATCDGRAFYDMAIALVHGQGFYVDDLRLLDLCNGTIALGPTHHWAPGLPIIEAAFVAVLGASSLALVLPLLLLSWAAVAVAWWTTRDLFGADAALLVAAAVSLDWTDVACGGLFGCSENLVLITFTLTLWAVVRGLRDERFIVLAGLFAGIGYLSKASLGWFFLIAGVGGVVYRVVFRGWRVLLNRWYWAGIAVFAIPVLLWSYRNISLFWDGTLAGLADAWQTSEVQARLARQAISQPEELLVGLVGKLPVLVGVAILPYLPLIKSLRGALRHWKEEFAFGMWLSIALIFVLGWFFAAVFWVGEQTSLLWADPVRYVMPASIPLLWLVVRYGKPSVRAWSATFVILAVMCLAPPVLLLQG